MVIVPPCDILTYLVLVSRRHVLLYLDIDHFFTDEMQVTN